MLKLCIRRNAINKSRLNNNARFIAYEAIDVIRKKEEKANSSSLFKTSSQKEYSLFNYLIKQDFNFLNELVNNSDNLVKNLEKRRLDAINIENFKSDYELIKKNENEVRNHEKEKEKLTKEINFKIKQTPQVQKQSLMKSDEMQLLIRKCKNIDEIIQSLKTLNFQSTDQFYLNALKLPNLLHPNTSSEENNLVLFEHKSEGSRMEKMKFNFNTKWSFRMQPSDITSRYLCGDYANLEFALIEYFTQKLKYFNGFEYIKSSSLVKSSIIEGCGDNFFDSEKFINTIQWSDNVMKGAKKFYRN